MKILIYLEAIGTEEEKTKFERIYIKYRKIMFYTAEHILNDRHMAEDAVHQAFLRIINHMEKIDEADCHKTKAFLVIITEYIAIDIYRKRKQEDTLSFDEFEIYISGGVSFEDEVIDEVSEAVLKFPINYSTVLKLKFYLGYSDFEIAKILDITEDNVRQRISRAKKKLSELLVEKGIM